MPFNLSAVTKRAADRGGESPSGSRLDYQLPLTQPPDVTLVAVFDVAVPLVIGQPLG